MIASRPSTVTRPTTRTRSDLSSAKNCARNSGSRTPEDCSLPWAACCAGASRALLGGDHRGRSAALRHDVRHIGLRGVGELLELHFWRRSRSSASGPRGAARWSRCRSCSCSRRRARSCHRYSPDSALGAPASTSICRRVYGRTRSCHVSELQLTDVRSPFSASVRSVTCLTPVNGGTPPSCIRAARPGGSPRVGRRAAPWCGGREASSLEFVNWTRPGRGT